MRYRQVAGAVRHLAGWKRDRPDHRDVSLPQLDEAPLPGFADLTPWCPPVRDQGSIGSCVANATLEAVGYLYTRGGLADPQLSRLDLYRKARIAEGVPPHEDSGCQVRVAMKVMATAGACLETTWSYEESFEAEPPAAAEQEALAHRILLYVRLPSLRAIKASLAQGFPVVGGFSVPSSMMDEACTRTGDVQMPKLHESFVGGHAVLFVGFNDSTKRLAFQNSWSVEWGSRGRGTLPEEYVESALADDFWSIRAELRP